MIGLDSSVLIRFLVEDDPAQTARAKKLVARGLDEGPCYVCDVTLCETVWVLRSVYRFSRPEIAGVLRKLKMSPQIRLQEPEGIDQALGAFEKGRGDFPDYLIRTRSEQADCRGTATFDGDLLGERGFIRP